MWSKGSQITGMSLPLGKDSNVRRDNTRKRNIETVVGVGVLRKRKNIAIVKKREGIDPDRMKDRDSVATGKDRMKCVIVEIKEVPAMRNNKNNVESLKKIRKDKTPQVTKAILVM